MPKIIAQKKAEEKKKNSSASSQSAYQQSVQIYNQQKQQDIAEAERLRNSINAQQSKTNQLDTLSGAQNYFDTVEAYRQRLLQLRGYGYNTSQAVQSIGTGAAQMRNALRGMSQADYLQQIALPQKYQGAGRNGVQAALERLSQQIQSGNRRTMTAAGVADVAKQALRSNGIAGTGASGTAQGEYNWLKQHQLEFWTEQELRAELGKKRAILEKYNSVYGDAASAVLRNYGGTLPELKNEIAALEGALRPKAYDTVLSRLPEHLRRDVTENAGKWQEQSRARVTNYQYDDGTGTADSETAQKNLDRLRADLRRQRLTEDQIESLLNYGAEQYNANRMAQAVQTTQNDARNHWALTSAASVPMNLAGGVTGFADLLIQRVRAENDAYTGGKTPLDFNSGAQALGNLSSTIRSTVGEMAEQKVEQKYGKAAGKAAGFLYQTGMSIADSTAAALTGQVIGVPNLAETLLSGSAAQQAAQDAHLRGASDRQALWSGVTAGAAEAFFEHASLENLRSIQRVALEGRLLGGAAFWKSVGVQAATEASEEAFTTIANTITDAIIMGDMSQINQQIQTNLLNGMSERDAIKGAWVDWIGQVALDAAGGAISGGVMGSGAGAFGSVHNFVANHKAQKTAETAKSIREFSQKFGKQAKAVETVYQSGTADADAFQTSFEAAYELGKSGAAMETAMTTKATQALNEEQRENAWLIGREAGVQEGTIKEEDSGASVMSAPTNAEGGTAQNGEGEAVRVRSGGERDAGADSVGAVQPVERSAGPAQTGREIGIGRDAQDGAAAEVRYGERVSAKDLGIRDGAVIRNMRVVQEDSYTPEMRELQKQAEASGRKLVLVSGLIHAADKPGGNITKARGLVEEGGQGRIFVQVDNASFTAKQIFGHENGHVRIQNGEIDLAATKQAVREAMTPEVFDRALQDYADAYYGITMTPDEVWEEIVCDAQGEMNIFDRTAMAAERERLGKVIREVRKASQETAREGETRAPPAETQGTKMSRETEQALDSVGIQIDEETESANPDSLLFSRETWNESEYVKNRAVAVQALVKALKVKPEEAERYIDAVNSVAYRIAQEKGRLDYEATGLSPFVSNAEYGGSFDFTTLCKKRRLITGTFSAIQNALPNTALTPLEILDIRKMMDDQGLEVNCGKCYVEGSRAAMGKFTKEFLRLYAKYHPGAYVPNMAEMNTPDGVEWVRQNHPEVYSEYLAFWNNHGKLKEGDPNLFASQQKPKLYQMRSAYNNDIPKHFKGDSRIKEKNDNGGLRVQSFSDFEIVHLIDMMQVIMDASRAGLHMQGYTKVQDFARAFGNTGLKINLSIDAWGVDENGKLIFNDKEGMPVKDAFELREKYSKNVGTICCVYDDAQLIAAMADPRIDFIIPFHRSQWKKSQYKAMGMPATTKDYTYQQNEKWLNPAAHTHEYRGRQVKTKCTNYMPNQWWDENLDGKGNAEKYLRMCAEDGKRPKFYKLLKNNGDGSYSLQPDGSTDGYWKLLIDFKMYDNEGNYAPQEPVRPDFNMDEINRMLQSYEGGHNRFPVAQGIVDEFVKKYKAEHKGAKFSRETDAEYMAAVESGDTARAQEMVDEAARKAGYNSPKLYHGTNAFGFTVIDPKKLNDRTSFFATDSLKTAGSYSGTTEAREIADTGNTSTNGVYQIYGNTDGFLVLDAGGEESGHISLGEYARDYNDRMSTRSWNTHATAKQIAKYAKSAGYPGVIIRNVIDDATPESRRANPPSDVYVFLKAKQQVKSADPVTYDGNGNPIPLDERFSDKKDLRFSRELDAEYMHAVQSGDTARAQEMVDEAARKAGYKKEVYHGTNVEFTEFKEFGGNEPGYHVGNRSAAEDRVRYELNKRVMRLYAKLGKTIQMTDVFGLWHGVYDYVLFSNGNESDMVDRDLFFSKKANKTFKKNDGVFVENEAFTKMQSAVNAAVNGGYKRSLVKEAVEAQRNYLLSLGIDSVEYKNVYEGVGSKSYMLLHANQVKSADPVTYDDDGNVIPLSERFNPDKPDIRFSRELDDEYLSAVRSGDTETAQRMVDEAAKKAGYPVRAYHQTGADFTEFSTDNPVAGRNDSETPNGIFFKMNDHDIGLEGKKQMGVYLKTGRMLRFKNREQANAWYQRNISGYRELQSEMKAKLKPFDDELEDIERLMFSDETDDDRYAELDKQWNDKLEEMRVVEDDYRGRLRELLNDYFLNHDSGYDSIKLDYDGHRYVDGKRENVETIILFDGRDVKSADAVVRDDDGNVIPLSERFNPQKTDIRWSREDSLADLRRENRALEKETDQLRRQVAKWKRETKRTTRLTLREQDVRREAKAVLEQYSSEADAGEVARKMQALGEYILNGDEGERSPSWETVREMARDIAEDIVGGERVMLNGDEFENFQLLTGILSEKPLHIAKADVEDLLTATGYESLREFNAAHKGTVRLVARDHLAAEERTVQDAYFEMVEAMPGWFPTDVTEAEYLPRMLEVLDGLRPIYGMSDETSAVYDEAVTWAANDIIDRMLDESIRQSPPTFADRAQAKLERTVAQERDRADRRVEKARETGERRLERQRDRFEERIARVREQGEKKLERTKRDYAERSQRAMDRLRERHDKQIADLKAKQRAKERRARDRRDVSAAWKQIQKLGAQFRQMADRPQQAPTKHAPRELANALAELAEQFRTENRRRVAVTLNDQIGRLENAYKEISDPKSEHFIYYSAGVDYMISQMKQELFDVATTDMTAAQLDRVYQTLKAAHHTIANANKFVHGQWLIDKIEAGRRWSNEIINAAPLLKKGLGGRLLNLQLRPDSFFARLSGFAKNSVGEQIQRMFVEGEERMLRIQQAAYEHFREFTESKEFDRLSKHGKKDLVDVGLKDADGRAILLTRDMMLGLYMHLRSTDNLMGAAYGGFDVPELAMYYRGDTATGYEDGTRTASIDESIIDLNDEARQIRKRIAEAKNNGEPESMEDLDRLDEIEAEIQAREGEMIGTLIDVRSTIAGMLTDYEKRLIEATDAWMIRSADYINEETRRMYGIEKANVEHYWPIHRNESFVNTDLVNAVNEVNLENWGNLKERVKSHAPIRLTGLGFEIENHTRKMSQFCGFAAVQRDFQQIYSTRLPGMHSSLEEQINRKFGGDTKKTGTSARSYIKKYVDDISGAPGGDKRTVLAPIRQNLARATLSLNFRVAMSQVASIPTAAAEIGWGSMAKGWARSSVKGLSAKQQAKLAAADPWFWQRSRGEGGMREFAEMRESNTALDRGYNKLAGTKLGKALLNWCQRFDMYATYTQWTMAEEWVKKHTEYRAGSEEFDAAVASKYRDIIRRTQPNYTVTERSDLLRDSREAMKWATMYKTQSNQNLNILYEATARLRQYTRDLKSGKNGVTEADVKQARVDAANAYTGVILGGTVAFALFRAAANAVIHAMNAYRDDDDELTAESFLKGLGKETMSAVAGMFLLGSEVFDFVYATISGDKYWGLTDSAVGSLDDILTQANKVIGKIGTDNPPVYDDWAKLANALMAPAGIPGKNAAQIVQGIWHHIEDIQNGEFLSFNAGVNRTASQETSRILHHYLRGDGDKVKKAYADLVELKGDESKAQSAMKDAVKNAFLDNQITDKQAEDMLKRYAGISSDDARAYVLQQRCEKETGIKYSDIREAYVNGDISAERAISLKQKYGGEDAAKAQKDVGKWLAEKETGIALEDIKDSYLSGDISRTEAISMRMKYADKTQEEAEAEALKWDVYKEYGIEYSVSGVQESLAGGEITETQAREIWTKYGGNSEDDVDDLVNAANFKAEHPDVDLENVTTTRINIYNQYAPKGTDAARFMEYAAQIQKDIHDDKYPGIPDGKGGKKPYSVMDDVANWINSLPITDGEKTALLLTYTNGKTTSLSRYKWS